MLPPLINNWFQILFHSPSGVLFTFPSRYSFTIGHQLVFSLTPWSGQIPTEFHVLRGTWDSNYHKTSTFRIPGFHLLWPSFPERSATLNFMTQDLYILKNYVPLPSHCNAHRLTQRKFRLFPFRSPLLRESLRFLFLTVLRCFSSRRLPPCPMYSDKDTEDLPQWVSPFGNLRIKARLTAPRSLQQSSTSFIAF